MRWVSLSVVLENEGAGVSLGRPGVFRMVRWDGLKFGLRLFCETRGPQTDGEDGHVCRREFLYGK